MSDEQNYEQEIEKLREELLQITELAKRTMADFQNLKRRTEEERFEVYKMANESLIKSLIPTLDSFHHAGEEMSEGIRLAVNQMDKSLVDAGLEVISPKPGDDFNPELHEALIQGEGEKDKILELLQNGYKLGKKVLRHAKVKVGV